MGRLESEQQAEGHAALFAALKPSMAATALSCSTRNSPIGSE